MNGDKLTTYALVKDAAENIVNMRLNDEDDMDVDAVIQGKGQGKDHWYDPKGKTYMQ